MALSKKKSRTLVNNRSAGYEYHIEERIEAGMVLTGTEIKSLRMGKASLRESYARIRDGEIFLYGMNIAPYERGNIYNVDSLRPRKLLLNRREIRMLTEQVQQEGRTIIPLRVYLNDQGRAKIEIALARGKKLYDKRETIAKKDVERRMRQHVQKEL
ncbi:MAG: SsrA-binding protein SmpB [Clostridiales Family XIII bacterium]|jgi:SsrA-binding protein|nr:SsrA-binding protein SmpB [Clostridiales Family XIII bacterium]